MTEKTKQKEESGKLREKNNVDFAAEKNKKDKQGNWSEDQREKSYYYDDAYGYEVYKPEEDDEADSD